MKNQSLLSELKPLIDEAICAQFENMSPGKIHFSNQRDFLPRQIALALARDRYKCKLKDMRTHYSAVAKTVSTACGKIAQLREAVADERCGKIVTIELYLDKKIAALPGLAERIKAQIEHRSKGRSGPTPNVETSLRSLPKKLKKAKKLSGERLFQHLVMRVERSMEMMFSGDDAVDRQNMCTRNCVLFTLYTEGDMTREKIADLCDVSDELIQQAVGWVHMTEHEDSAEAMFIRTFREMI